MKKEKSSKYGLLKVLGISFLVFAVLSWIIKAGSYSGSTYTAPANGYFALELQTNNQGQVALYNIVSNISGDYYGTKSQNPLSNNNWVAVFMPVQKNATIKITYKNRVATDHFRFIYAEGSK